MSDTIQNDQVIVELIGESVNAPSRPRRVAASLLVEALRREVRSGDQNREILPAVEAKDVAEELRSLVATYAILGISTT